MFKQSEKMLSYGGKVSVALFAVYVQVKLLLSVPS